MATTGSNSSSSSDYEELTYDPSGNVLSRRLRDGQVISYQYDALDRLKFKNVPNLVANENDVIYGYDLLGRLTQATDSANHFTTFVYDALGRRVREQSNWTTRRSDYDAAGRRTRLTWGDGFFVTYEYDTTGQMTAIRENGGTVLASFEYDDLGRRVRLTRGNGTVTTYGHDAVSRLESPGHDLTGTAQDVSHSFTYTPSSQIATLTRSNPAYAWTGQVAVNRSYTNNGLNQVTQTGATSLGHDARLKINL